MDKKKQPTWGRFKLVELLGTGGMEDVYKAFDPNLKRYIAQKILRHEGPGTGPPSLFFYARSMENVLFASGGAAARPPYNAFCKKRGKNF